MEGQKFNSRNNFNHKSFERYEFSKENKINFHTAAEAVCKAFEKSKDTIGIRWPVDFQNKEPKDYLTELTISSLNKKLVKLGIPQLNVRNLSKQKILNKFGKPHNPASFMLSIYNIGLISSSVEKEYVVFKLHPDFNEILKERKNDIDNPRATFSKKVAPKKVSIDETSSSEEDEEDDKPNDD